MFSSGKPKHLPGVPPEVSRVYNILTPKPKELLTNAFARRFIREGEVGIYNHKERRTKRRYLYLFNDVLLITKKESAKSYWLKIYISLRTSLKVEDVPDSTTKYKVEFRIYAPKKTIILFTHSEEEKHQWLRDIKNAADAALKSKEESQNPETYSQSIYQSSTPSSSGYEKEKDIEISGDIGTFEIPGIGSGSGQRAVSGNYGDFSGDYSSDEEPSYAQTSYNSGQPKQVTEILNIGLDCATPPSTPVQGSAFDDFDSIANRSSVYGQQSGFGQPLPQIPQQPLYQQQSFGQPLPQIPQQSFGSGLPAFSSAPLQPQGSAFNAPFGSSLPLGPTTLQPTPGNILRPTSILQPTPANAAPNEGFAALKGLAGTDNSFAQNQPQQMYNQGNMYDNRNTGYFG